MECSVKMVFCALFFTLFTFSTGAETENSKISFKPSHYTIEIFTIADHFKDDESKASTFDGVVTIDFDVNKPEDFKEELKIVLDADANTKTKKITLKGVDNDFKAIEGLKSNIEKNKLIITCPKEEAAKYKKFRVIVEYSNAFGKDMTGFYRSSYKDSENKTRWLLTTHFEPIYARKAFPCFDQPDLKATFEVKIKAPKDFKTVLSNTALEKSTPSDDSVLYEFKKTPFPMSTYLVAFTVSDFKGTESVEFESDYPSSSKRKLTTYGREDIINKGDGRLAQIAGKLALDELKNFLKLGFAFEKVDQVGIPDFSAGAMENWGHISFREKALFFNNNSSTTTKQSDILTITHELVHQWFGNLVTLKSWNYIWLNEAFANYLEYVISSKFTAEEINTSSWDLMEQFVVTDMHLRAFETDGLDSSKSLNYEIPDENLIESHFNDIPYAKGASVLRMWDLTHSGFQESLIDYIAQRKTLNAEPSDLFKSFKTKAKMEENTFTTWTNQAGYPVVEVQKKNNSYILTQSRFLWNNATDNAIWNIPITYSTDISKNFNTKPTHWLYKDPLTIEIKEKNKWIIVNNQQAGYYRVNYDKENWNALSSALLEKNYSSIPELNRAQIINDVYSLARSLKKDYVDYATALDLSKYLQNEKSFIPLKTALSSFDFLQNKVYQSPIFGEYKKYVLNLIKPHFKNLNADDLSHVDKLKNIEISRWACALDYEPCVKQAKDIFNASTYSKYPDTQEIVLCTSVRNEPKAWDQVFEKYKNEQNSAIKIMYLSALGCTTNKIQVEQYLNKTLESGSVIRKQDLIYVLLSVSNGNIKNIDIALNFIEKNYEKIAKEYGGINPLGKAIVSIAKKLNTKEELKKLQELKKKIDKVPEAKPAEESVQNAIKIASSNVDWSEKKMNQFNVYFNSSSLVSYSILLLLVCLMSVFMS